MAGIGIRNVVALLAVLWLLPAHAQAKRVALVVGFSNYQHTAVLKNPRNDAEDMGAIFRDLDFEVMEAFDLDHRSFIKVIRQFSDAVKGADAAVLFYSGHGLQVGGTNYLVPVDADLTHELEVEGQTVRLDLVLGQMEREAKTSVVFLDACRDNPLARSLARSMATRASDVGRGLAPVKVGGFGTFISFATAPNAVALDGSGRNSPFTTALKKHLGSPGSDLSATMINVRNDVIAATQEKQVPWENSALRAQFFFKAALPVPPQPPEPSRDERAEAAMWAVVKDAGDAVLLQSFLDRFPTGVFAPTANLILEKLRREEEKKQEATARESELRRAEAARHSAEAAKKESERQAALTKDAEDRKRAEEEAQAARAALLEAEKKNEAARKAASDARAAAAKAKTERQEAAKTNTAKAPPKTVEAPKATNPNSSPMCDNIPTVQKRYFGCSY